MILGSDVVLAVCGFLLKISVVKKNYQMLRLEFWIFLILSLPGCEMWMVRREAFHGLSRRNSFEFRA